MPVQIYSFYIFDRHTECVYSKLWLAGQSAASSAAAVQQQSLAARNRASDDAKLIFGTVFSLRNMARKLGGDDDAFICYRTSTYKLHYYETPTNLRFVLLTEPGALSMRNVLHQIYINLWVEYGRSIPLCRYGMLYADNRSPP